MIDEIRQLSNNKTNEVIVAVAMPYVEKNSVKEEEAKKGFSKFMRNNMNVKKKPVRYFPSGDKGVIVFGERTRIQGNPEYLEEFIQKLGTADNVYVFGMPSSDGE